MKKNKIVTTLLALLLLFAMSACAPAAIVTEAIPVNGLGTGERACATDPVGSGRARCQQAVVDWLRPVQTCATLA